MTSAGNGLGRPDAETRRQTRLLGTFLVLMTVVFGIGDLVAVLTRPEYELPWYGYLFLLFAALFNRAGHYTKAAILTLLMFPLVTLASVLGGSSPGTTFSYLIIGVLASTLLLDRRNALLFDALCFAFLLLTPATIPKHVPDLGTVTTPLLLVAIGSGLAFMLMIHRDELERERQEALRTSEERLLLALDASHMGTWEWDTAAREVHSSERAQAIFGLHGKSFDGTQAGYLRMVHPEDLATVGKELTEVLSGEKEEFEFLHRVVWADGSTHWIQVQGRCARRGASGRRVNGTVVDVTDRRLAEAERDRLIHELEQKNAELERFTYTVSHDLKSPLITVRGFLGSIEADVSEGRYDRLGGDVERILSATARMQTLLEELLKLSRIGRIVNPPERVAFADLAREAMDLVRGRLDAAGAEVEIQEDLPDVFGDRSRLVQVLQNLLDNAAKFVGDQKNPRILVGSRPGASDGRPVFFVQDNGEGVDAENLQRMLGLFQKLDDRSRGTGVGLAIVKRIVEVHGGKLWVESPGRGLGTTVCFTLPTRAAV
ncbi:MAG: PAS domain-containing protein [Vicinamibacteria bacterium]|nr:PAS domain-containing protein [Vicinamibacteria bacterium]